MDAEKRVLLEKDDVQRTISRMAHEIAERSVGPGGITLIGIRSRGAHLARRIGRKMESVAGAAPAIGVVDVRPYRDDVDRPAAEEPPHMDVPVTIDDRTVVLVDDVINTGRTIRAALEMLGHLGKPQKILVATLVDRGDRELPIRADIVGKNVKVEDFERVNVLLQESDGSDLVTVTGAKKNRA